MVPQSRLPEMDGKVFSDQRVREELIRVQNNVGFILFCNAINNKLDELDVILNTSEDRERLATAAIKRQTLASLVSNYYSTIELPTSEDENNSPSEA